MMKNIDVWEIRNKVFDLFGFGELNEPTFRTLIKAHLIFLSQENSKDFERKTRELRQAHQRYM